MHCYCYYLEVGRRKRVVNDDEDTGLLVCHLADGSDVSYLHQGVAGGFYPHHLCNNYIFEKINKLLVFYVKSEMWTRNSYFISNILQRAEALIRLLEYSVF